MSLDPDAVLDALTLVVEAVRESAALQTWVQEAGRMSESEREQAIAGIAQEMRARRESEELVTAFGLLAQPPLFDAVTNALRDYGVSV